MVNSYCPHIATCPFYRTWSGQKGNDKIDVIYMIDHLPLRKITFDCYPLMNSNHATKRIAKNNK